MISSSKVRHLRLVINVLYYFLLTRCTLQPSTLLFYILDLQRYMYSYMGTLTDLHRGSMWNQWFQTGQSWCHFPQSCWTKTSTTETFTKYLVLKNNVQILVFKTTVKYLLVWVNNCTKALSSCLSSTQHSNQLSVLMFSGLLFLPYPIQTSGLKFWLMLSGSIFQLTLHTDIWFVVRVPVLSEQMTEVHPRVSTDGRLLTIAFFLAILRVPKHNSYTF